MAAGVRYLDRWGHWTRDERGEWHLEGTSRRVVFAIVDKVGDLIGIQGRKIADGDYGEKMLTNGRGGIFVAGTIWPLDQVECVAIVEAPIDALSLAAAGKPTLATQGTSCPDWLPLALAFVTRPLIFRLPRNAYAGALVLVLILAVHQKKHFMRYARTITQEYDITRT